MYLSTILNRAHHQFKTESSKPRKSKTKLVQKHEKNDSVVRFESSNKREENLIERNTAKRFAKSFRTTKLSYHVKHNKNIDIIIVVSK